MWRGRHGHCVLPSCMVAGHVVLLLLLLLLLLPDLPE
jgi:hypothetical protein